MKLKLSIFLITTLTLQLNAQEISGVILDSITKKPIAFANIITKKTGTISNEEGKFKLILKKETPKDTLTISYIGFKTIAKPIAKYTDSVIYMTSQVNELKSVFISNKNYTAEEIINKVKENIKQNYRQNSLTQKRLFFRESQEQKIQKFKQELKKSTIREINPSLLKNITKSIPKKSLFYTEILCDFFEKPNTSENKIKLIKACKLYDKNKEAGLKNYEKKLNEILEKNIKKDSYFKIKSGWFFGTKINAKDVFKSKIDSSNTEQLKKIKKEKELKKQNFALQRKSQLTELFKNLFYKEKTSLNFITKSNRYEFELKDISYIGNEPVYIISFKPKRKESYKGKLYINTDNFAVVKIEYENTKALGKLSLLGISYHKFLDKGKMIFSKNKKQKYHLAYIESTRGTNFGVKRPLKIKEKNKHVKGRRKQNEISLKLDVSISQTNKKEVVIFENNTITQQNYHNIKTQNTVMPVYLKSYQPNFWKGYNIIEPNKAIKNFTTTE